MTELLYQTDSYLKEFEAVVTAVEPEARAVVLDRTAFYPGGGGQPCDFGLLTIGGVTYPVERVRKQGEAVLHFLGGDEPLPLVGACGRGAAPRRRCRSRVRALPAAPCRQRAGR